MSGLDNGLHPTRDNLADILFNGQTEPAMAEIIPMTEEQKFQLEIYKLAMNRSAVAEEAFQLIGTDELRFELFKIHFQLGGANSDIVTRIIEAVHKSKEALYLFTIGA